MVLSDRSLTLSVSIDCPRSVLVVPLVILCASINPAKLFGLKRYLFWSPTDKTAAKRVRLSMNLFLDSPFNLLIKLDKST